MSRRREKTKSSKSRGRAEGRKRRRRRRRRRRKEKRIHGEGQEEKETRCGRTSPAAIYIRCSGRSTCKHPRALRRILLDSSRSSVRATRYALKHHRLSLAEIYNNSLLYSLALCSSKFNVYGIILEYTTKNFSAKN